MALQPAHRDHPTRSVGESNLDRGHVAEQHEEDKMASSATSPIPNAGRLPTYSNAATAAAVANRVGKKAAAMRMSTTAPSGTSSS